MDKLLRKQFFQKLAKKQQQQFFISTVMLFKIAQNVNKYLGYFYMKICY